MSAADEHRTVAAAFSERVLGAPDDGWGRPAPCEGWLARDVVRHLVEWSTGLLLSGAGLRLPTGPSVDVDPVAAWSAHASAVQDLLDDPVARACPLTNPHLGELPVEQALSRFYVPDVFLHTWDLARATGQDERLDPERCAAMLEGMLPMDAVLRQSGQYGPRVEVAPDADAQTRLLAFIGRSP